MHRQAQEVIEAQTNTNSFSHKQNILYTHSLQANGRAQTSSGDRISNGDSTSSKISRSIRSGRVEFVLIVLVVAAEIIIPLMCATNEYMTPICGHGITMCLRETLGGAFSKYTAIILKRHNHVLSKLFRLITKHT